MFKRPKNPAAPASVPSVPLVEPVPSMVTLMYNSLQGFRRAMSGRPHNVSRVQLRAPERKRGTRQLQRGVSQLAQLWEVPQSGPATSEPRRQVIKGLSDESEIAADAFHFWRGTGLPAISDDGLTSKVKPSV